ncbi:MAG: T9SS type A sorting domain-containing protein [Chlorobi bacterium]|nr:T9SS type A sorting domain-containing protein [Chlorobiota bacterium]
MKLFKLIIIIIFFWRSTGYNQDFPPPTNFYADFQQDSIYLSWQAPGAKSFSHYNIYFQGFQGGLQIQIGSTTDTIFSVPHPTFAYNQCYGISAEYINPIGNSDTLWTCSVIPLLWVLPTRVNFEEGAYSSGMVANIIKGYDNWELTDSIFYSQGHSAKFTSDSNNFRSILTTTAIQINDNETPKLSFMCKIPGNQGNSDTLKLYYYSSGNWHQIFEPLSSIEEWHLVEYSLESLPSSFHFGFEAISGKGNGVFIDDIVFEDKKLNSKIIVDTNKIWSVITYFYYPWSAETNFIRFTIDTIIGNNSYKKVIRSSNESQINWTFFGYIREDSTKKVFYRLNENKTEKLIYDFNVQLYDTITVFSLYNFENETFDSLIYIVSSIDSLLIGDSYKKQFHLDYFESHVQEHDIEQWIEGMGSMSGILHNETVLVGRDGFSLLCFTENDTLQFIKSNYTSCYYEYSGIEIKNSQKLKVYITPNPVKSTSVLSIVGNIDSKEIKLEIFNMSGELIINKMIKNSFIIKKSDFEPGLYIYKVIDSKGKYFEGKIMVR